MPIMIRDLSNMFQQMSGMPINSKGGKSMLKQAGIDTSSKQYQAVMKRMGASAGAGVAYTNPQAIKNLMSSFDKDGKFISPSTGLTGLTVDDSNLAQKNRIIKIPESSRQEMFEVAKMEFIANNGNQDGETTKRSDVYLNLYKKTKVSDRLAAGNTLGKYEYAYRQAFADAAKKADPKWDYGKPIPAGALDGIKREDIEASMRSIDVKL